MRSSICEFMGTFFLVFAGTGAIIVNDLFGGGLGQVGIALSFGLVVMVVIYAIGDTSGAHINPAVTLGFYRLKRIGLKDTVSYIISQCLGAVSASLLLSLVFPMHDSLGTTQPNIPLWGAFIYEDLLTFLLMFVILSVATGSKEKGLMAGLAIGATVGLEALFAGPVTGASMNPARSFSPALVSGDISFLWLYISAPILGAVSAVYVCKYTQAEGTCC